MNELTEKIVFIENDEIVTNSKQVAESFGKQHKHVLESIDNIKKDVPNFRLMFTESELPDGYGRPQRAYLMNRDGFSLLAMGFTGKRALEFKLKYIEAFNQLEQFYNSPDMIIKRAMDLQARKIIMLETKVDELKPKALFAEAVESSKGSILVRDLAKILKQNNVEIGEKRLFAWLRDNGYLIKKLGSDYNSPTQRSMNLGVMEFTENTVVRNSGDAILRKTPKVTGKGQTYFVGKFLNDGFPIS